MDEYATQIKMGKTVCNLLDGDMIFSHEGECMTLTATSKDGQTHAITYASSRVPSIQLIRFMVSDLILCVAGPDACPDEISKKINEYIKSARH
jgi:hypothetical protein